MEVKIDWFLFSHQNGNENPYEVDLERNKQKKLNNNKLYELESNILCAIGSCAHDTYRA